MKLKTQTKKMIAERLADRIATGKRKFVTVDRELLYDVGTIFEKKYEGEFTWFGLGNAICIRTNKKPLKLRA